METKYNFELIKDFLDGTLDVNTSNQISSLIKQDETARDIAKGILLLKNKFDNDGELEAYLNKTLSANLDLIVEKTLTEKSTFPFLKIAAAFVLIAVSTSLLIQYPSPTLNKLVNEEIAVVYQVPPTFRDSGKESDVFSQAMVAYSSGEFLQAAELLKADESSQVIFYRGLSYLYAKEYDKSIEQLSKHDLIKSRYKEQARWYLTLAYLKSNNIDRAKEELQDIVEASNHYKTERASELLDLLSE
ncbi:hypothetical protein [Ekhidna sp.]|uniref:tetratricopeptide repeat protein n=1 Tax=Ekhidna sp. TaxID=2608089 RepID=UPI0032ECB1B4